MSNYICSNGIRDKNRMRLDYEKTKGEKRFCLTRNVPCKVTFLVLEKYKANLKSANNSAPQLSKIMMIDFPKTVSRYFSQLFRLLTRSIPSPGVGLSTLPEDRLKSLLFPQRLHKIKCENVGTETSIHTCLNAGSAAFNDSIFDGRNGSFSKFKEVEVKYPSSFFERISLLLMFDILLPLNIFYIYNFQENFIVVSTWKKGSAE
jgi:hypothetical protein